MSEHVTLDSSRLELLAVLAKRGRPELLDDLVAGFETHMGERLAELARDESDANWKHLLHKIRGSAANIGAVRLASLAEAAEALVEQGGDPRSSLRALREASDATVAELKKILVTL